jgi:hypothetical protein
MDTLYQSINSVLSKLDDPRGVEYPRDTVGEFIQEGYDGMLREVEALFDVYHPDLTVGTQTYSIPEKTVKVDRVTYDYRTMQPEFKRWMAAEGDDFETETSYPSWFTIDSDGLNTIRIVGAPSEVQTALSITGVRGTFKSWGTEISGTISGVRGVLKRAEGELAAGTPWGAPKKYISDAKGVRVEYFRLGSVLTENDGFEVPHHYVKAAEYWAMSKCLEMEGTGQDLKLSAHFRGRYESAVISLRKRVNNVHNERIRRLGGKGMLSGRPPLARLPWPYEREGRP